VDYPKDEQDTTNPLSGFEIDTMPPVLADVDDGSA
jgi:hypothetical protein